MDKDGGRGVEVVCGVENGERGDGVGGAYRWSEAEGRREKREVG